MLYIKRSNEKIECTNELQAMNFLNKNNLKLQQKQFYLKVLLYII